MPVLSGFKLLKYKLYVKDSSNYRYHQENSFLIRKKLLILTKYPIYSNRWSSTFIFFNLEKMLNLTLNNGQQKSYWQQIK